MTQIFKALPLVLTFLFLSACDSKETQPQSSEKQSQTNTSGSPSKQANLQEKPASYKEIEWVDLVPEGYRADEVLAEYMEKYNLDELEDSDPIVLEVQAKLKELLASSPVNEQLEGQNIKLAGYLLPLEYDGITTSEFLLVPYFGACIHVPPPPANQTIYVKSKEPIQAEGLFDAVWVSGKLKVEHKVSQYADSGYFIEAGQVAEYELPPEQQ
ncbi:MAG: DUF3299 domain-containing protein [Bacteroidota bacterium]